MFSHGSPESLKQALRSLRAEFQVGSVGAGLFPCISNTDVSAFEKRHSVLLPPEYRYFLTIVGNGGTELFKLGEMDDGWDFRAWEENDGFIGILSEPFQYSEEWNDLTGHPEFEPGKETDEAWLAEYDRKRDLFYDHYWIPINGAIPIAHWGCAIRLWLVVTGPERGNVWHDDRANLQGLKPLKKSDGSRLGFLEWCKGWPNG